jgi:acyl carrier protein
MTVADNIGPRITRVFTQVFGRKVAYRDDLHRKDEPRWTSLKHVEFIIALETEFNVRFDGADATDMVSIAVVSERVRQRLA